MKPKILIILYFSVISLSLGACGLQPKPIEITIEMNEFAYNPDTIEVSVGQKVTLRLVNKGALEHELMIGREVMSEEGIPHGFMEDFFKNQEPEVMEDHGDGEHSHDHGHDEADHDMHGFMVLVPGGNLVEKTVTFTVTEDMIGEWEIGCFVDAGSHYEEGMRGKLVVTP